MTNQERLISLLGFAPPPNAAEGALLDNGVTGTDVYEPSLSSSIKKAAIEVMNVIITTADTGNAQTGFQIKYDRQSILQRIKQLQDELDLDDAQPKIKGIRPW